MSYYKVKSINLRDWNNISVTAACNNVRPMYYSNSEYTGTIEDLFQDLLSGNLQINSGNKQKVHDAYLQVKIFLKENKVNTYELYRSRYKNNEHYNKAFKMFKDVLKGKQNKKKYYIQIEGRNLYSWRKYGYSYSYHTKMEKSFTDLLKAQLCYNDVKFQEVSPKK